MPTRWERLAGDTDVFAVKIAFMDDPDEGRGADEDHWRSWGSFQIWVHGTNLCAHLEEGERIESVHWYLLPFLEWFVRSWDPLLHEERLPCANNATAGWMALRENRFPSPALNEDQEVEWEEQWQSWWSRHSIDVASEGGIFPDVVFRRCRDLVEVSWGNSTPTGTPGHVSFIASAPRAVRLQPLTVADPLYEVVAAAAQYLSGVLPDSHTVAELNRAIRRLRTRRRDGRLMWLAGAGPDGASVQRGWKRVKRWLHDLPQTQRSTLLGTTGRSPLVVEGSCHAALMYGSMAPSIAKSDMMSLAGAMVRLSLPEDDVPGKVDALCRDTPLLPGARPWSQGYELAEDVHEMMGLGEPGSTVDVERLLADLGIEVMEIELGDTSVRGVAVAGPHHRPGIAWNTSCSFNESGEGRRFTLAHEFCHVLFDRGVGKRLAIASGRWAPLGIEQRANAFAAMFLMPVGLVGEAVRGMNEPVATASGVQLVANRFQTGFSSTLRHLRNLAVIDDFDRQRIEAEVGLASPGHRATVVH